MSDDQKQNGFLSARVARSGKKKKIRLAVYKVKIQLKGRILENIANNDVDSKAVLDSVKRHDLQ
jgi:hypothetical protein